MNWWQIITTILGSSTISTVITYFLNRRFNNKKLHAEIVSKARIDWINEFRNLSSKYLYEVYRSIELKKIEIEAQNYMLHSKNASVEYLRYRKKSEEYSKLYNESFSNMTKASIQLRLYLPKRTRSSEQIEHKNIKEKIDFINNELNKVEDKTNNHILETLEKDTLLKLTDYIARYLKTEWEKAKNKR